MYLPARRTLVAEGTGQDKYCADDDVSQFYYYSQNSRRRLVLTRSLSYILFTPMLFKSYLFGFPSCAQHVYAADDVCLLIWLLLVLVLITSMIIVLFVLVCLWVLLLLVVVVAAAPDRTRRPTWPSARSPWTRTTISVTIMSNILIVYQHL